MVKGLWKKRTYQNQSVRGEFSFGRKQRQENRGEITARQTSRVVGEGDRDG